MECVDSMGTGTGKDFSQKNVLSTPRSDAAAIETMAPQSGRYP